MDDYLSKLRKFVPARALALYLAITGLYPAAFPKAADLPIWLPFVTILVCLAAGILVNIFVDKDSSNTPVKLILSGVAFLLLGVVQPYAGISGVLHFSAAINFVFFAITIAYVMVVSWVYKPAES
jgi:ABC-type Fe3+-siderophore transport system permease subunit